MDLQRLVNEEHMTVKEVASALGVTAPTVRRWGRKGGLPVWQTPKGFVVFTSDLEAFISDNSGLVEDEAA